MRHAYKPYRDREIWVEARNLRVTLESVARGATPLAQLR